LEERADLLKLERQQLIHEVISNQGWMTVSELSEHFDVSEITIRRDLQELTEQGLIRRTHGGATTIRSANVDPPIIQRIQAMSGCKKRIARTAVQLIEDSTSIFVGSGSTTAHLTPYLIDYKDLTVVTNALNVADDLVSTDDLTVVVVGGMLRASELSLVGHITEQALAEVRVDKAFIGMAAIGLQAGLTNDYLPEVMTDRKIFDMHSEKILLADHTKFGKVASAYVAPIERVTTLVTDDQTDQEILDSIRRLGVRIVIAE
jgi:DeoR/GlpR family transcriptional regulator of sugar metabolism